MRTLLLVCLAALSFSAGGASASTRLSDAQMDRISAGALPSCVGASMCSGTSITQSSTTVTQTNSNGVVMTTTTNTGPVSTTLGSSTGGTGGTTGTGGTGDTGGTGGSTGTGGTGGTTGTGGTGGSAPAPAGTGGTRPPLWRSYSLTVGNPLLNISVTSPVSLPGD